MKIPTNLSTTNKKYVQNKQKPYRSQTMPEIGQDFYQTNGLPYDDLFESVYNYKQRHNTANFPSNQTTDVSLQTTSSNRSQKKKKSFGNPYLNSEFRQELGIQDNVINKFSDRIFNKYDFDGNHYLDRQEIYAAVKELYELSGFNTPSKQKVLQIFDQFDYDGNGVIDILEFRQILQNLST